MPSRADASGMPLPLQMEEQPQPGLRKAKREGEGDLSPLNFRVPAGFRREFKTYAARHDLKLNELLRRSFEAYRRAQGD
jgi:hypothetical protein